MRTIETTATVTEDGKLIVQAPPGVTPGEHHVVVVIDDTPSESKPLPPLELHVAKIGAWPADFTFRREDLYGDDGR